MPPHHPSSTSSSLNVNGHKHRIYDGPRQAARSASAVGALRDAPRDSRAYPGADVNHSGGANADYPDFANHGNPHIANDTGDFTLGPAQPPTIQERVRRSPRYVVKRFRQGMCSVGRFLAGGRKEEEHREQHGVVTLVPPEEQFQVVYFSDHSDRPLPHRRQGTPTFSEREGSAHSLRSRPGSALASSSNQTFPSGEVEEEEEESEPEEEDENLEKATQSAMSFLRTVLEYDQLHENMHRRFGRR